MNCPKGGKVEVKEFVMTEEERIEEFQELARGIFREIHRKLEVLGVMRGETFSEESLKLLLNQIF